MKCILKINRMIEQCWCFFSEPKNLRKSDISEIKLLVDVLSSLKFI